MAPIPTSQKRPFIPAPGVAQVEMVYTLFSQTCENVFHVDTGTGASVPAATLTAIGNQFSVWHRDSGRSVQSNFSQLTLIRVRDLTVQAGDVVELSQVPADHVGELTEKALPGNVTVAVKWSTGLGGRSFRGRTYHIGLTEHQVDLNALTLDAQTAVQTAYANLLVAVNGVAGRQMVVVSYAHNKFWRDAALSTPITRATVNIDVDSQRRRLNGRGA